MSEHKNLSHPFNIAPTNVVPSVILEGEDYGLKASINDLHNLRGQSVIPKPDAANPRQVENIVSASS